MNGGGVLIFVILAFSSVAWAAKTCNNPLDVVLVVEDTNVLRDGDDENELKDFLARLVNHFNLGPEPNLGHVAFQLYNDQSHTVFNLNKYTETTDAKAAILITRFSHAAIDAPSVGSALNYTLSEVLRVQNGERSCFPVVVILVSYSSYKNPNAVNDERDNLIAADVSRARQLRNAGARILTVGVGPKRDPELLIDIAGGSEFYYDVPDFSSLSDAIADDIANRSCEYKLATDFYPCEMETINADLIFVVDVSTNLNATLAQAVGDFIANYLRPYRFGINGVQAALVVYDKVAEVINTLNRGGNYEKFIREVNATLSAEPPRHGTERYIYNALDVTYYHVMVESLGFRPNASHSVFVFTADCFTGPDPALTAQAIRDKDNTNLYLISLGSPFGFWKETLDVTGDPQRLYEVPYSPEVVLPYFLPKVFWRALCASVKP